MTLIKTFVTKVSTPWGDVYPQAVVGILKVRALTQDSNIAEGLTDQVIVSEGDIIGGTYEAIFFNSAETQAQGKPHRPVQQLEGDRLTEVFTIDAEDDQVKVLLAGQLSGQEKRDNIARVQFIKHFA